MAKLGTSGTAWPSPVSTGSTRIGASVKLSLTMPDGDGLPRHVVREIDAIGIEAGDCVLVDLRDAKVFVEDYAI